MGARANRTRGDSQGPDTLLDPRPQAARDRIKGGENADGGHGSRGLCLVFGLHRLRPRRSACWQHAADGGWSSGFPGLRSHGNRGAPHHGGLRGGDPAPAGRALAAAGEGHARRGLHGRGRGGRLQEGRGPQRPGLRVHELPRRGVRGGPGSADESGGGRPEPLRRSRGSPHKALRQISHDHARLHHPLHPHVLDFGRDRRGGEARLQYL
mmetsp:Transcript_112324/g.267756  ORF Transcript_112324/g.267756 Transcript_112324/m.267756 type:complete len:210 (+) Transcript_112324:949-1578(+)